MAKPRSGKTAVTEILAYNFHYNQKTIYRDNARSFQHEEAVNTFRKVRKINESSRLYYEFLTTTKQPDIAVTSNMP